MPPPRRQIGAIGYAIIALVAIHLVLVLVALLLPKPANPPSRPVLVDAGR